MQNRKHYAKHSGYRKKPVSWKKMASLAEGRRRRLAYLASVRIKSKPIDEFELMLEHFEVSIQSQVCDEPVPVKQSTDANLPINPSPEFNPGNSSLVISEPKLDDSLIIVSDNDKDDSKGETPEDGLISPLLKEFDPEAPNVVQFPGLSYESPSPSTCPIEYDSNSMEEVNIPMEEAKNSEPNRLDNEYAPVKYLRTFASFLMKCQGIASAMLY
jgi:hypothetical protein